MLIFIFLLCFILLNNAVASDIQIDIFKTEGNICSIDAHKDNKNDPCSPETIKQEHPDKRNDATSQNTNNEKIIRTQKNSPPIENLKVQQHDVDIVFFYGEECPHCKQQKPFLQELKHRYKTIKIHSFEVWHNRENAVLFERFAKAYGVKSSGVPMTFIGNKVIIGFSEGIKKDLQDVVSSCLKTKCPSPFEIMSQNGLSASQETGQKAEFIDIPFIGKTDVSKMALPLMTIVIAGLDSFNPCAFFVLLSLLGLMIHARSRTRMLIIGGIFVFFSGFIYFLFMSAWLNFFLIMGEVAIITAIAGIVSIIIALINIKDFFAFKKGVSLTISDEARTKLFDRMRKLLRSTSIIYMVFGTIVLAIAANAYELLCTAGFPMVFTRILTLHHLTTIQYYLYLIFYNVIYIIPLGIIVIIFTVTLGKRQLTEKEGRFLKLLSGMMMMGLGLVLLIKPALLNNVLVSVVILCCAVLSSVLISTISAFIERRRQIKVQRTTL
ncbi:MAG: thioredoxin domain-containing protein [Thermodesulfovibrionales bacterium]|nr:thioredoxin domain-containing protein [Thermodesulfovibrionales bacterium]